jgi:uncharacterized protein YhbP (UPF0306 family)
MADAPTQQLVQQLASFLEQIDAMILATVDSAGLPHATNLYLAADEHFNLYFLSESSSNHVQHLTAQPWVSVAGHAPVRMWQQVRGVQIQGVCQPVPDGEREEAWQVYSQRYPHVAEIDDYVRAMTFYRVEPRHLRWIDNSVHFGYKVDLDFPLPQSLAPSSLNAEDG